MISYKNAQKEARQSKVPLARIAAHLDQQDRRIRNKAFLTLLTALVLICFLVAGAGYYVILPKITAVGQAPVQGSDPTEVKAVAAEPVQAPQRPDPESDNLSNSDPEPRQENSAAEAGQEPGVTAGVTAPIAPATPPPPESIVRIDMEAAIKDPATETAEGGEAKIDEKLVAAALAKMSLTASQTGQTNSCVSLVRQLAKETVIYFPISSVTVLPEYLPQLRKLGEAANRCPEVKIDVGGHTDSTGELLTNLQLSWQRSEETIKSLKTQNIDTSQFLPVGFSNSRPALQEATGLGQAKNRRVEFTVR